jgi:hypothetical protein
VGLQLDHGKANGKGKVQKIINFTSESQKGWQTLGWNDPFTIDWCHLLITHVFRICVDIQSGPEQSMWGAYFLGEESSRQTQISFEAALDKREF